MADDPHSRPMLRPRPVADLPIDALLELASDIARGWAVALIRARPLEAIGEVPLQSLAGGGRSLCEQLLRALCGESELDKLLDGSPRGRNGAASHPRQALEIAGGGGPGSVVETIESLRGVVWETIASQLGAVGGGRSPATLLGDLSDRLANVCAALSAAAVAAEPMGSAERPDVVIASGADAPAVRSSEPAATRAGRADTGIVIVDERGAILRDPSGRREAGEWARREGEEPVVEPEPDELPARPEIAIRDARGEEGPAAWIRSIGRQLEHYERDGLPFAVVLLEIEGADTPQEHESLERVLADELRESGGGTMTRERAGRYWLLAHRADRIGAHALAVRLERALATAATPGAPVVAASGIAICPEDGLQSATLAAQADVGLYAARSEAGHASAGPGEPPV
ncbi:MAG TPA: hypothetical protein VH061_11735 [Solirubrobacteraceae bacterium]|jgi:hypothetical protein|nr:hypothetical protein [Solirubrobacteraceae bacterium]